MSVTNTIIYLLIGINVLTFVVYGVDLCKSNRTKKEYDRAI